MKISIITVVKNNKPGLLRAIECVRNQTYKNVEHIIVDGGSMDGTKEMMKNGRLMMEDVKFSSEADEGIYDAINKGIKLATGDVIGLLHSDDLYADENVLEKYGEVFTRPFDFAQGDKLRQAQNDTLRQAQDKRVDAVYSDLVYVSQKSGVRSQESDSRQPAYRTGRAGMTELKTTNLPTGQAGHSLLTTHFSTIRYWKTHKTVSSKQSSVNSEETDHHLLITDHLLKKGWMPPHPTLFIKKEIFEKYGYYRTDMKIAADYEMILRLLYKYKITSYYLPLTTYLMSIGGASNKSLKNILRKSKEDYLAMKINGINFPLLTLVSKNLRKLPQFLARDL